MISRRRFLWGAGAGIGLLTAGRATITDGSTLATRSSQVRFSIGPEIPRLMFFPECKSSTGQSAPQCLIKPVRITVMQLQGETAADSGHSKVKVIFSNGQEIILQGNTISNMHTADNGRMYILRKGILLKNIVSWTLESLFKEMRYSKAKASYGKLRANFLRLQEQEFLESVTVEALLRLVLEVYRRKQIRSVLWDKRQLRFIVN